MPTEYTVVQYLDGTYDVRDGVRVCVAGLTEGQALNVVKELQGVVDGQRSAD